MTDKTLAELAKELKTAIGEAKGGYQELVGRMEKGEKLSENLKGDFDEFLVKFSTLQEQVSELEQKGSRTDLGGQPEFKSLGHALINSDGFKSAGGSNMAQGNRIYLTEKAALRTIDSPLVAPERRPDIVPIPQETLTIRDLFAQGTTSSNAYQFVQETGFANNAKATAEGEKLPESSITSEMKTVNVQAIGHHLPVSKYLLDDAPGLQSFIDNRMIYGVKHMEDRLLLLGDGMGANIMGVLPQASAFSAPAEIEEYTIIDQLRLAALQGIWAEYPMSGIVLHPMKWAEIELMKDTIGRYIIGNPQNITNPTMWGLPVVQSHAMAGDGFVVGAFKHSGEIKDREEVSVEIGYIDKDFINNQVTIKAYERLALAIYRPEAFIKGTLVAKVKG